MNDYWNLESSCQLKHFFKAEGQLKEAIDKAVRSGGKFDPEGGELRNFLTSVENLELAVGHYEEFSAMKADELKKVNNKSDAKTVKKELIFYENMLDSSRYLRQRLSKSLGKPRAELESCLKLVSDMVDMQVEFMRGNSFDGLLDVRQLKKSEEEEVEKEIESE